MGEVGGVVEGQVGLGVGAAEPAEAVAELLTDPRAGQVRECEAPDCVLLFLPAHPRRRWCVAGVCGNRARVARYYARYKDV
ncbi:CGNR zinc finger domain-containing protein [Streptomyces erythrochromogenes]|uniref:CGNR zinc finger domain-containing protein n=1 Tax=Streptomyces erythrochromogenes TaxID=285574 RepID=UPI0027E24752|nr:CGNR zinc finger domain-containing protein [Streptomyces erythrochromogenes]